MKPLLFALALASLTICSPIVLSPEKAALISQAYMAGTLGLGVAGATAASVAAVRSQANKNKLDELDKKLQSIDTKVSKPPVIKITNVKESTKRKLSEPSENAE
ncbi:hypothetical protein MP638_000228 [Amoeboaphelidium occidentale]|nr:hypothetical protein MP638_000228 [Amoeboaphelidium occidentale]